MINISIPCQIVDMIEREMSGNAEETILEIVELLDNIKNDPNKFIKKLENELEKYAEKNDKCFICGRDLEIEEFREDREYQGFPYKELVYKKYCPQHGYAY